MNEYNLSLRLQYAVVVAIWSRKKSEYSLEKPLEMLCVCVFDYCKFPPWILPKFDHYKFLLEFISVVVVVVVLRVCSITVRFSLLFSEFLPLV